MDLKAVENLQNMEMCHNSRILFEGVAVLCVKVPYRRVDAFFVDFEHFFEFFLLIFV